MPELAALVDRSLPRSGSSLDRLSLASQSTIDRLAGTPVGRPIAHALRGNEWLGHPAHPVVIALPVGAWLVAGWHDARSVVTRDARDEHAADSALRIGIAGAVVAAATGLVQYLDTKDVARRETAVHAALNNIALGLYLASSSLRRRGRRPLARRLSATALAVVGVSGYLGGDIAFRHGVGVRPQALRSPELPASATPDDPVESAGAHHA